MKQKKIIPFECEKKKKQKLQEEPVQFKSLRKKCLMNVI